MKGTFGLIRGGFVSTEMNRHKRQQIREFRDESTMLRAVDTVVIRPGLVQRHHVGSFDLVDPVLGTHRGTDLQYVNETNHPPHY